MTAVVKVFQRTSGESDDAFSERMAKALKEAADQAAQDEFNEAFAIPPTTVPIP